MSTPAAALLRPKPLPIRPDGIPQSMRDACRWMIWNYEERGDKWTKVPYVATASAQAASSTDPSTFRTFAEALGAYEDGKCDGLGFALGDGWAGYDCDGGDAPEHVKLLDTYTKRSVGGNGVHAIAKGVKPGTKSRVGCHELYDPGRYFTVSGHHVAGTPTTVEERTAEIAALYARLFPNGNGHPQHPTGSSKVTPNAGALTDDQVIAKATASKNGDKFAKLWKGDVSGYPSQSEADMALCSLLAFWTNRDSAQMDRLFRRSGLMRDEKWGRLGADLIAKAIASTRRATTPTRIRST